MSDNIVNQELVRHLKTALAMAEAGRITNAVIVATGADVYHRMFSVPKPENMAEIIGELGIFKTEMELIVIGNRGQVQENRRSGIIGPRLAS